MPKEFLVKAGETRQILWLFSSSIPGKVKFRAEPVDGSPPRGKVEINVKKMFSTVGRQQDLLDRNVLDKGFTESNYKVLVTPEVDTRIIFETRHFRAETFFVILAGIMILGLVSALTVFIFVDPVAPKR